MLRLGVDIGKQTGCSLVKRDGNTATLLNFETFKSTKGCDIAYGIVKSFGKTLKNDVDIVIELPAEIALSGRNVKWAIFAANLAAETGVHLTKLGYNVRFVRADEWARTVNGNVMSNRQREDMFCKIFSARKEILGKTKRIIHAGRVTNDHIRDAALLTIYTN